MEQIDLALSSSIGIIGVGIDVLGVVLILIGIGASLRQFGRPWTAYDHPHLLELDPCPGGGRALAVAARWRSRNETCEY